MKVWLQREKNAWTPSGQIPKESIEGSSDSTDSKEFVDPQCQPLVDVDPMDVEGPSLLRTRPTMNEGKRLGKRCPPLQGNSLEAWLKAFNCEEMSNSLKNISDVIIESRSISTRTLFA